MKGKQILIFIGFVLFCFATRAQGTKSLVPLPNKIVWQKGSFLFSSCTHLQWDKQSSQLEEALAPLVTKLARVAGIDITAPQNCKGNIVTAALDSSIGTEEGYVLTINPTEIQIKAKKPGGVFYAVQTLLQLLPPNIESPVAVRGEQWKVPGVRIEDAPRFSYRGIMLDVARHHMAPDSIKRLIDLLAMQKMNRLHWHLTDNDGWRFESRKYPKLTSVGAYRKGSPIENNITFDYKRLPDEPLYGGYYTQEQMRDIVAYAAKRFITVIPEIEMPAHAMATIAAYPSLSCLDSNGHLFPYPEGIQGEFCTKDETFNFLTDVLEEVMDIFPSEYLHIGGDEAEKANWKKCRHCQQRMKEEGLKNVQELQSYFIKRIERFVNGKGRKIIGWDEIMEGGVAPNAAVMSWTGEEAGFKAAMEGHAVVMTPLPYSYFDHPQSTAPGEPEGYPGLTMLSNVYAYNPVPATMDKTKASNIKGVQGNLWTEYVPTAAKADYMLFPRSLALAEVAWTKPVLKNYADFIKRLVVYNKRLDFHNVNYSKHLYDIRVSNLQSRNGKHYVTISGSINNEPIYYTLDGSLPNEKSAIYKQPVAINQSSTLYAAIIRNGEIIDLQTKQYILHKGVGKKGTLRIPPDYVKGPLNSWHNGSLTDDKRMNDVRFKDEERYNDDKWLGWYDKNFEGTLDFGKKEKTERVTVRFYHNVPHGIMIPRSLSLQISDNGKEFRTIRTPTVDLPGSTGAVQVVMNTPGTTTRYLRVIAEPYGRTPAGNNAALFVDEAIVE